MGFEEFIFEAAEMNRRTFALTRLRREEGTKTGVRCQQ
jgi:hypothetical protein